MKGRDVIALILIMFLFMLGIVAFFAYKFRTVLGAAMMSPPSSISSKDEEEG